MQDRLTSLYFEEHLEKEKILYVITTLGIYLVIRLGNLILIKNQKEPFFKVSLDNFNYFKVSNIISVSSVEGDDSKLHILGMDGPNPYTEYQSLIAPLSLEKEDASELYKILIYAVGCLPQYSVWNYMHHAGQRVTHHQLLFLLEHWRDLYHVSDMNSVTDIISATFSRTQFLDTKILEEAISSTNFNIMGGFYESGAKTIIK